MTYQTVQTKCHTQRYTPIKHFSTGNLFQAHLHKIFIINFVPIFGQKTKHSFKKKFEIPHIFDKNDFEK